MASQIYNEGKKNFSLKNWTTDTFKVLLLMTNTTADTENDGIAATTDFTTLDEHDGTGYAQQTLASPTVTKEDANDRAMLDAADVTFATLGAGSRDIAGVLIVWDDATILRPWSWHEYASPRVADGTNFVVEWRADTGIILVE
jgi:hypothetical protein